MDLLHPEGHKAEVTHFSEKEKDERSLSAISKDDSNSSREALERGDSSFAEKRLVMLLAPQTESTTGEEGEDFFELICLT